MTDATAPVEQTWSTPGLDEICIESGWGEADAARTIGSKVLTLSLQMNPPSADLEDRWRQAPQFDWSGASGPGRITVMSPKHRLITDELSSAAQAWLRSLGIDAGTEKLSALACQGASYHHDAASYGGCAFLVVWHSEDAGWDLVLPQVDVRIPLVRDLAVIFDPALVHGVVLRGKSEFLEADFDSSFDMPRVFGCYSCMDLPMDSVALRRHLGVSLLSPEEAELRFPLASDASHEIGDRVDVRTGELRLPAPKSFSQLSSSSRPLRP